MDNQLKSNGKGVSWRHSVRIFFKAQISAQFASFVDFLVTILLVKAFAVFYLYATFTGSVVGGIVNCAINYGWVFHAEDCKKTHVAVKYLFVWGRQHYTEYLGHFCTDRVAYGHDMGQWAVGILYRQCIYSVKDNSSSAGSFFFGTTICNVFSFIVITI